MDTIQKQSIDEILRKLAETAGFSDICAQKYSGYFKDIKDYIYLNDEKYRPQHVSLATTFSFVNLKNELLAFLGWSYYNLKRMTILHAMFIFLGLLFSLFKGIYNTCALHTQVSKQASVARILFAGFFGIFLTSINKILLDAQISENNKNDQPHQMHKIIHKTTEIQQLVHDNHTIYIVTIPYLLFLVPRNYRNRTVTEHISLSHSYPQSLV